MSRREWFGCLFRCSDQNSSAWSLLRPAGSDPGAGFKKILFLKVSVSLSGFAPSVAHGKLEDVVFKLRKTRQKLALSLTPLGAVRAAAQGTGYKNRRLGKSHRRFGLETGLVCTVRCALSLVFLTVFPLALRASLGTLRLSLFYVHRSGWSEFYCDASGEFFLISLWVLSLFA